MDEKMDISQSIGPTLLIVSGCQTISMYKNIHFIFRERKINQRTHFQILRPKIDLFLAHI
jgi:hypothetical protein